MPDRKFIRYLKKCKAAQFNEDDCADLYFADKFKYKPLEPKSLRLAKVRLQRAKQRGITAKVKKETANLKHLRKTYRALKRWYKDTR